MTRARRAGLWRGGWLAAALALCVTWVAAEEKPVPAEAADTPPTTDAAAPETQPPAQASTHGGPAKTVSSAAEAAAQLPPLPQPLPAGLETKDWIADEQGNPVDIEKVVLKQTGEDQPRAVQAWKLNGGAKPISAWRCEGAWTLDLAAGAQTQLRIYNATAGALKISVAYSLGEDFVWHESPPVALTPGWNALAIKQGKAHFKCAASEWQHSTALPKEFVCRGFTVVLHSGRRTGRVFLAGAQLQVKGRPSKKVKKKR